MRSVPLSFRNSLFYQSQTGHFGLESLAIFNRNGWPFCVGILSPVDGRIVVKYEPSGSASSAASLKVDFTRQSMSAPVSFVALMKSWPA
jgi:hypothetical protein